MQLVNCALTSQYSLCSATRWEGAYKVVYYSHLPRTMTPVGVTPGAITAWLTAIDYDQVRQRGLEWRDATMVWWMNVRGAWRRWLTPSAAEAGDEQTETRWRSTVKQFNGCWLEWNVPTRATGNYRSETGKSPSPVPKFPKIPVL